MRRVTGDLIALAQEGAFDAIVHGCNCFCTMGAGLAKGIAAAFPDALEADRATPKGERAKLGTCSVATCEVSGGTCSVATCEVSGGTCDVINAYTQFHWSGRGVLVDYDAIRSCMAWIQKRYSGQRIGLPQIGAGLARGDWATIEAIVLEELSDEDVTLVIYG